MTDFEKLIAQCKSSDVDIKIDGVTKLQREFESGSELTDPEGIITVLKSCLRTSNQHLVTATLSALPPCFPLVVSSSQDASAASIDGTSLKQILIAFLPAGGLIDRLGETRERTREKARESLVVLGGLAYQCNGTSSQGMAKSKEVAKGQETPLMVWERFMREGGLQSKVWRVREQAILTLVHVRRAHRSFPIRPYLTLLVETLEDTDGNVRDCSRQSIVELFTGPGVTDGARADLKKEMNKKGVRKTIVDSVVAKLLSSDQGNTQSEGSDNGDVYKKEYVPPSLALQGRRPTAGTGNGIPRTLSQSTTHSLADSTSRPASRTGSETILTPSVDAMEVPTVYVASSRDLENEFSPMLKYFEGKETEHNWAARERSVIQIRGMIKGDAHIRYPDTFLAGLKNGILDATLKALASLRTTVSAQTCSLYADLAINLGPTLDPFCEVLLTHLLRMAGFTKKIVATQSQGVVSTIITHTSAQPRMLLHLLWNTLQDKMVQARSFTLNHVKKFLDVHGQKSKHSIESSGAVDVLEKIVRKGLADPNVGVRETARNTFWAFEVLWRDRGAAIIGALDATARKQLEKVCPDAQEIAILLPTTTPRAKKSSVAAAIAASRAKAKAIATAPPSLRHQATSASHAVHAISTSPGSQHPISPATSTRSLSGLGRSPPNSRPMSPASPSRRVASFSAQKNSASGSAPTTHNRSRSTESTSPPSSPSVIIAHRRSSSGQTHSSTSSHRTLNMALQTALPASPPHASSYSNPSTIQRVVIKRPPGVAATTPHHNTRTSLFHTENLANEPSLLLASNIPIPDDSESDSDEPNPMLFSDRYLPQVKATMSGSSTGSQPLGAPDPIVEDALRARAEQAESAAERLLELVEIDDDMHISSIPPSLIKTNGSATTNVKPISALNLRTNAAPPSTPVNKISSITRQAALFRDSPAYNGKSSLMDILKERKNVTGWWLKRMTLVDKGSPLKATEPAAKVQELSRYVTVLEEGAADRHTLKKLALFCMENPFIDTASPLSSSLSFPMSPSPIPGKVGIMRSLGSNIWTDGRMFDRMFDALFQFLSPEKDEEELEYGLIVIWEMLENQGSLMEGHEADVFSLLLRVRFCNKLNVLEATNTIRDALTARVEPVYGLTTLHGSLRTFQVEPLPPSSNADVRAASYAFGLIALGKFILQLPAEVLEEELPRLQPTLTSALNDTSSLVVRESAAASIIASQLVLRDEAQLFLLLDGLADEKKNLLTYLFDKHGVRGRFDASEPSGAEKLEREMRRLDGRTNTPPRSQPLN